jgi:mono/diheme cytochrome c family protein
MMKRHVLKRKFFRLLILVFTLLMGSVILNSCYYDNEEYLYPANGQSTCDTLSVTYNANIAPIFANNCNGCHNSASPGGNIITDNHTDLVANINKVWLAINHFPGAEAMPKGGGKLSDCEIAKIKRWKNLNMPNN